jgi:hypothetical protein
MAIVPEDEYPGQTVAASGGYPYGSAQNVTVQGDGTGTPLEERWVNDLWGFLQALLDAGDVTPSGDPDEVGASDYLTALRAAVRVELTPAQITSTQDNYGPPGWSEATLVRLSSDATRTINGFDATAKVKRKTCVNVGANAINLAHLAGGQTAGNQVTSPNAGAYMLGAGDTAIIEVDATSAVWRVIGGRSYAANHPHSGQDSWGAAFVISPAGTLTGTGSIDISGTSEAAKYTIDHATNEYVFKTARQRTFWLPASEFVPGQNARLADATTIEFIDEGASGGFCCASLNRFLPTGASITAVAGRVNQNSGVSAQAMRMDLVKTVATLVPPFTDTITAIFDVELSTGTSGAKVLADGFPDTTTGTNALPATAAKTTFAEHWTLTITASDAASSGDPEYFYGALITYMDPGPRNA